MPEIAQQSLSVLVVDDDTSVQLAVKRILTSAGHRVVGARDGEEGLELLRQLAFDVAVVDWYMPGISGRGFVLGALDIAPGLPVLLTSGSPETMAGLAGGLGRLPVLSKPWSISELREAVASAAGTRRAGPSSQPELQASSAPAHM